MVRGRVHSEYARFLRLEDCGGRVAVSWFSHVVDSRTRGGRESKEDEAKEELMKEEETRTTRGPR